MIRLLLVRHGQSTWNEAGRWQGQEDPPLTVVGRRQAMEASAGIGAVDGIFCSTLERARVTAEILAEQLGVGPVVELPGLIERHAGDWQGLTRTEIEERYPGYLAEERRPPGWETDAALRERAFDALGRIVAGLVDGGQEGGDVDLERGAGLDVVVVTHGGLIYQVEGTLGAPFERLANLGGRWLVHDGRDWRLGDRVDLLGGVDITVPEQI